MEPARTGTEMIKRKEVKRMDQGKSGRKREENNKDILEAFNNETIKLIEPKIEDKPAK